MEIVSRYNSREVEEKILEKWLEAGYFQAQTSSSKDPFSIVIPPPNITGILHMGHALNNTIQDVLVRFKRMQGYESLWMPGTDHAGIATQNVVEKGLAKEGLRKEDLGRDEFQKRLWAWKDKYGSTIIEQLKKLGVSCDWPRIRFTMDDDYSKTVREVFVRLHEKGLVYRGNYIINWCPRCKTALSDEEASHQQIDGWLYYIRYPVKGAQSYIVVATTRPETMLGDTAVAVNPSDRRYEWLKAEKVILPIAERELKVIEDDVISPEFGTGVVKVTPAHDPVDFMLGKKYNLDFINIMNDDATLNANVPKDFIGMDRFKARAALIKILAEKKLIEKKEPYAISAGHCYRCHTIVEPRISLQWFVKMKPLAEEAIRVVEEDEIKFYPQRWKKVYLNWMQNIQDWCISRQIWWGHRLPVYYCKSCQTEAEFGSQKPADKMSVNTKGVIVSKERPAKCPSCGSIELTQDEDVLDTWFSSWLWPFATFYWPFGQEKGQDGGTNLKRKDELAYFYPTNCLVTASEILFFWVARMIMAGLEFMDQIPFRDVIIHGTVRDEQGIKMSKSLGNIIDPLDVIDKFGADALRFSLLLLAASGSDVYLSDEKFLVGRNFSNKIWNATRFIFLKINESDLMVDNFEFGKIEGIDEWILKELNGTIEQVSACLDNYSLNEASKKIYDFFWHVFCDWYIEIIKDNFTLDKAKVAVYVLLNSLKLLHPFMPFITEEIFGLIKNHTALSLEESLVISSWPSVLDLDIKKNEVGNINMLLGAIKEVRNIKIDLGLGQKKIKLEVKLKVSQQELWQNNKAWIGRLTSSEDIIFKKKLKRVLWENDLWALNLDIESVDMNSFLASLDKKINNLESILSKAAKKLRNENFLKRASSDIVDKEKNRFDEVSSQAQRLKGLRKSFT